MKIPPLASRVVGTGSLQQQQLQFDRTQYVLRLKRAGTQASELLRNGQTYRAVLDPDQPGTPLGVDDGLGVVRLKSIDDRSLVQFTNELESEPDVEGAFPVLRNEKGDSIFVVPAEAHVTFKGQVSHDQAQQLLDTFDASIEKDLGHSRFRVKLKPNRSPLQFVEAVQSHPAIESADVSLAGTITAETGAVSAVTHIFPFRKQPTVSALTLPTLSVRPDTVMVTTHETEDAADTAEFLHKIQALVEQGTIAILKRDKQASPEGVPSYLVAQVIDESEAPDATINEIRGLTQVDEVIPGMTDNDGILRFANLQDIVIGLTGSPTEADWQTFAQENDLTRVALNPVSRLAVFRSNSGLSMPALIDKFRHDNKVRLAEPAYISDDSESTPDTQGSSEFPAEELWNHQRVHLTEAWQKTKGSTVTATGDEIPIVIAVVDQLADLNHKFFQGRLVSKHKSLNFSESDVIRPHSTHVIGIVIGTTLDGGEEHSVGLAPRAMVLPVAINTGFGRYETREAALNFLADVATNKGWTDPDTNAFFSIRRLVINCSWKTTGDVLGIQEAIERLVHSGALVICSSGNENLSAPHYPSDYAGVLSVSGTDRNDRKLNVSNFGQRVDLCAPGGDGDPLDPGDILSTILDNKLGFMFGTSMASPHVAALAALIWSLVPNASAEDVAKIMKETADNIDAQQMDPALVGKLGKGRINAQAAVAKAAQDSALGGPSA
jgi:hypothetical protein